MVRPHLGRALQAARRLVGSDDLAWDAVQEALLSLWREPRRPPNVSAWLVRTVMHRGLHQLRSRSRRRRYEAEAAAGRHEESCRDEPSQELERKELRRDIENALERLPRVQREVFVLRELEQLDYDAIAARLAIPIGTVRSRLNRCRESLRQMVGVASGS